MFVSLLNGDIHLKKIYSSVSHFFLYKGRSHLGKDSSSKEANRSHLFEFNDVVS